MRVLPLPCVVTLRELFSCSSCIETLVYEHVFFDLYLGFFAQLREEIRLFPAQDEVRGGVSCRHT